ncbi:MAG: hypothetical protein K2M06_00115 [Muribaculaceae bacterium]|nr:hypothetical protein [Muribaculaceae bacterium]
MKKIYILFLAAALTGLSASAAKKQAPAFRKHNIEAADAGKSTVGIKRSVAAKVAATAGDLSKMVAWTCKSTLENNEGEQTYAVEIVLEDESTGEATVILDGTMYFELQAQFDAEAGTISIPTGQEFEDLDEGDMFYIKTLGANDEMNEGNSGIEAAVGVFDGTKFVFPEYEFWAFGNPDAEEYGFWELCYKNVFEQDKWFSIGEGNFTENILYPFLKGKENTIATEVEVFSDGAGNYKISDPLRALYDSYDISEVSPSMVLETHPDLGYLIGMTNSGLGNQNIGFYYYYSQSWMENKYGDPEDFFMPMYKITKSVDGEISTITIPVDATILMTSGTSQSFSGSAYPSVLTFNEDASGIGNVKAEEDGTVRYFNLQGMPVEKASEGIVVRVKGGKAEKIVMK